MIKPAHIQWSDDTPVSTEFDDVYYSKINGIDETRYVFLQHNELPQRWIDSRPSIFTIAETGFGTGLNFLCTCQQWLMHSQAHQTLHFVSVEKFPLSHENLRQALQPWTEFDTLSKALLDAYPAHVPGWHTITLPNLKKAAGSIVLHLFLGDISDWLVQMNARVDAWFLDGFTPSRNPDMWRPSLFHAMARLSHRRTTMATFTAAGDVRRGLQAAGFKTKKAHGFGKKREMLYGYFNANQGPIPPAYLREKPWFTYTQPEHSNNKHAIVIGAGISGCASAYALAIRGWQVTLVDEHKEVAGGASGNAQGVLYAKLASDMNIQSEFYLAGYLYSLQLLKHLLPSKIDWDNCGVLQLAFSEKERKRQQQFCERFELNDVLVPVNAQQASELAGTKIENSGLYFKQGAWVSPTAWCSALINHRNIQFLPEHRVHALNQTTDQQWQVKIESADSKKDVLTVDNVIVCCAHNAKQLTPLSFLPTKPIAGQVSDVKSNDMQLNMVLCGDSYVTPTHNQQLNFGATYRIKSENCDITDVDHEKNRDKLEQNFPSVAQQINPQHTTNGRVSVRCTTPDYVPIVGQVCDETLFKHHFKELNKSKHWRFYQAAPFLKGLYLNIGHGSRGLSSAPLCAALIAAQINNEPWPITASQAQMLSPNRFLVAQAIKGD